MIERNSDTDGPMKRARAPEVLLAEESIRKKVAELGAAITRDFRELTLCVMPVLDGGMIFTADLIREIRLPLTLLPIKVSSYGDAMESPGTPHLPQGVPDGFRGRNLLLVDDILDTGHTLETLKSKLLNSGARSVATCVLLRKKRARSLHADYVGFEIEDMFVVGYGLDLAGRYRNLPFVGIPDTGGE